MALRANRSGSATATRAPQTTAGEDTNMNEQPSTAIATRQSTAISNPVAGNAVQDLNAGILDNIDNLGSGGNYVTVDGTDFLFKASGETAKELEIIVKYGKRKYVWFDEDSNSHHESDTKLDNRYKLKFDIKWDEISEEDEVTEYQMTLSTTSSMQFIDYVKKLAQQGKGVGQVITKMTISRQTSNDGKNRYSRVDFEFAGDAE